MADVTTEDVEAARQRVDALANELVDAKQAQIAALRAQDNAVALARLQAEEDRLNDEIAAVKEATVTPDDAAAEPAPVTVAPTAQTAPVTTPPAAKPDTTSAQEAK